MLLTSLRLLVPDIHRIAERNGNIDVEDVQEHVLESEEFFKLQIELLQVISTPSSICEYIYVLYLFKTQF